MPPSPDRPGSAARPAPPPPPSTTRLYWRGVTRRCPVCGQGHLFRRWVTMAERCPRCGLRFERVEGHWTGALGINTVLSFGLLLITLLGGFLVTYPDVPAVGLMVAAVAVAALAPFVFFPVSKTLWLAIDLHMRGPSTDEVAPEFAWAAAPDGSLASDSDNFPTDRGTGADT